MRWKFRAYWLILPLLAACTQDFSVFGFDTTQRHPARTKDASVAPEDEAPDAAATVTPSDGGESTSEPARDAGNTYCQPQLTPA